MLELWAWYFRAQFAKFADEVCANARFGLDDLRSSLAVSKRGSFSGAANILNVNHSTVLRASYAEKRSWRIGNPHVVSDRGGQLA
jgi:hypothetical protein